MTSDLTEALALLKEARCELSTPLAESRAWFDRRDALMAKHKEPKMTERNAEIVRAALEALREPTEAMIDAFDQQLAPDVRHDELARGWRSAITAALGERKA